MLPSRRNFLSLAAAASLAPAQQPSAPPISVFSKHLQFLEGAELLDTVKGLGFDGIDLTVRKGGHVAPDRIAQILPPLVRMARDRSLLVPMVTSDIVDAASPNAELVLDILAQQNIRHYRWGGFKYQPNQPVQPQLDAFRSRVEKLAQLNAKYRVKAIYHTHSGLGQVGASIWDAWLLVRDFDPAAVSINYDSGHASIEGGYGGWNHSLRTLGRHLGGVACKDYLWQRNNSGQWRPAWAPLGEGMTQLQEVAAWLRQTNFNGPIQLHFEYPLGGADTGKSTLTVDREVVYAAMRRDLSKLRSYWA